MAAVSISGNAAVAMKCFSPCGVKTSLENSKASFQTFLANASQKSKCKASKRSLLHISASQDKKWSLKSVATDNTVSGSSSIDQKTKYHFVVANAKFMLDEEEHLQEVLRERMRHFAAMNREMDFWILYEPEFLNEFPEMQKRLSRPAVAIVSTDAAWILYIKIRLDRCLKGEYEASNLEEALQSKPVDIKFEKPENWIAPYPKYETNWWIPFLPVQFV